VSDGFNERVLSLMARKTLTSSESFILAHNSICGNSSTQPSTWLAHTLAASEGLVFQSSRWTVQLTNWSTCFVWLGLSVIAQA